MKSRGPSIAMIGAYSAPTIATAAHDHAAVLATKGRNAWRPHLRERASAIHAAATPAGNTMIGSTKKPSPIAAAHSAQSALLSGVRTRAWPHSSAEANRTSISV